MYSLLVLLIHQGANPYQGLECEIVSYFLLCHTLSKKKSWCCWSKLSQILSGDVLVKYHDVWLHSVQMGWWLEDGSRVQGRLETGLVCNGRTLDLTPIHPLKEYTSS